MIAVALLLAALGIVWWRCRSEDAADSTEDIVAASGRAAAVSRSDRDRGTPASPTGRVIRKDTGEGLAGAIVTFAPHADHPEETPPFAITDAAGNWSTRIAAGSYVVTASVRGYAPAFVVASTTAATGLSIMLERSGSVLRGVVTDIGGRPIANARVTASRRYGMPRDALLATSVAITDRKGGYELTLALGSWDVAAEHDDYVYGRAVVRFDREGALDQNFELVPASVIRGRVSVTAAKAR